MSTASPQRASSLRGRWRGPWQGGLARARRLAGGRCPACRDWADGGLCAPCDARFAGARPRCPRCALPRPSGLAHATADPCPRCRHAPPPWQAAVAGVDYGHPWAGLLAGLKFQARLDLAPVLVAPLRARLAARPRPADLLVVPAPLAPARLRERGYNQAWELARRLAATLELDACPDALFRIRETGHQLALPRAERARNLRGAFAVAPERAARVRGRPVALVDDVLTTGATAAAATDALRAAGAASVEVWVVARTSE